jgi:hypothetical protein
VAEFPAPDQGFVLTHFIVSADVGRSAAFYADVLGGEGLERVGGTVEFKGVVDVYPQRAVVEQCG